MRRDETSLVALTAHPSLRLRVSFAVNRVVRSNRGSTDYKRKWICKCIYILVIGHNNKHCRRSACHGIKIHIWRPFLYNSQESIQNAPTCFLSYSLGRNFLFDNGLNCLQEFVLFASYPMCGTSFHAKLVTRSKFLTNLALWRGGRGTHRQWSRPQIPEPNFTIA